MLGWIAVICFMGLTCLAGFRLLGLWQETRKLPELLIAILIFGVGTVAVGLGFLIRSLLPPGALREVALFVPIVGADVGMAALCIFTWQVYRPRSPMAQATAFAAMTVMAGLLAYAALGGSASALDRGVLSLLGQGVWAGAMGWSAGEAFLYWTAMRRRLQLGLADPLVTNRVLLWGVATGTAALGIAIGALGRHLGVIVDYERSWVTLCYAGHGVVSALAFWLAFAPPEAYVRWIAGSAHGELSDASGAEGE